MNMVNDKDSSLVEKTCSRDNGCRGGGGGNSCTICSNVPDCVVGRMYVYTCRPVASSG